VGASKDIKESPIAISASGDNTILTPTSGKALRISSLYLVSSTAANITLKAGVVSPISISGSMPITYLAIDPKEPMMLSVNQTFIINLGSAVSVTGFVIWWEV
jgi:hypothetical protein